MTAPSIKGTTFQKVVDDLLELVERGHLSREEIEARLETEDLAYLDEKVSPVAWIPIVTYARAIELLAERHAPSQRQAYLVERGAQAAERLASLGIYSQLEATTEHLGPRIGHMIVSLAGAIFNFGRWRYQPDEHGGFTIRVEDAVALPEVARFTVQGFVQHVASRAAGLPMRVVSDRPNADLVVYRGIRAL